MLEQVGGLRVDLERVLVEQVDIEPVRSLRECIPTDYDNARVDRHLTPCRPPAPGTRASDGGAWTVDGMGVLTAPTRTVAMKLIRGNWSRREDSHVALM